MVGTGAEGRGKGELSSEFRVSVRQDEKFERFAAVRIQLTLPQCTRKDGQEGKFDVSVVTIILTELKALQRISVCRKGQVPWGQGREENRGVRQAWECVLGSLPRSLWTLAACAVLRLGKFTSGSWGHTGKTQAGRKKPQGMDGGREQGWQLGRMLW